MTSMRERVKDVHVTGGFVSDLLIEVLGRQRAEMRREIRLACNQVREEIGLPIAKPRIRVPWQSNRLESSVDEQ